MDDVKVKVVLNTETRVKSGHGIHCDRHSLELLLPVLFYLSSQVAPLPQLATSMFRQDLSGCPRLPVCQSVNPRLQDPALHVSHVTMREFFVSIQNILVGNSSSLYQWNTQSEAFVLPPTADGKPKFIVVDGKDDALMQRYI